MKKYLIPVVLCIMMILAATAFSKNMLKDEVKKGDLKVMVEGFKNNKGFAKIALCNSEESFDRSEEKSFLSKKIQIVNGKAEHVFQDIPMGSYAVSVYHDENANGKLDKSFFGKPLEMYGFSNNAGNFFSRPDYEDAIFSMDKKDATIVVNVK